MLKSKLSSLIVLLGLGFSLSFSAQTIAGGKIVKWVDSNGVTHYGDKLPTEAAGKKNQVITKQGVTVQQNTKKVVKQEDEMAKKEKLEQKRKDDILLASYTKPEEIELARDRNLEMTQATLQALIVQKENVDGRTARNQAKADEFIQKGKPVPDYLKDEIKLSKAESAKLNTQITEYEKNIDKINEQYNNEKTRFIALKQSNQ